MTSLLITQVNFSATLQDAGRAGYLMDGITCGGAMDGFAHRLGQKLVGNPPTSASIEVALGGLKATFGDCANIALTGARCQANLNNQPIAQDRTVTVPAGAKLDIGGLSLGTYVYLSVSGGGFQTNKLLGSRSVVVRDGIGQPLTAGAAVPYKSMSTPLLYVHAPPSESTNEKPLELRYLPGFHKDQATTQSINLLESGCFSVSNRRDRMAIAIDGDKVETGVTGQWSEPTVAGAIQIPPDGRPLILMADRQTVGGYPIMGALLSPDWRRLSQATPGTPVVFRSVSESQAEQILWLERNYEHELTLGTQIRLPPKARHVAHE